MSHAENFVLRSTPTSPFGRKVRMAIDALGMNDRVTVIPADPLDENDTLRKQNPLGKMPCLVLPDDGTIYDSGIIIEFLQDVAGTDRLLPLRGRERYRALTLSRLADGVMDASILVVYESRSIRTKRTLFRSVCRARSVISTGASRSTGVHLIPVWFPGSSGFPRTNRLSSARSSRTRNGAHRRYGG
jgi:glutathione S-transferase